jgi:hypothetical protein
MAMKTFGGTTRFSAHLAWARLAMFALVFSLATGGQTAWAAANSSFDPNISEVIVDLDAGTLLIKGNGLVNPEVILGTSNTPLNIISSNGGDTVLVSLPP